MVVVIQNFSAIRLCICALLQVLFLLEASEVYRPPIDLLKSPSYCIDAMALKIFERRFTCLQGPGRNGTARSELEYLKRTSASEYFRAHELLAHEYFVETLQNPFRKPHCYDSDVEFEYIPILPLSWIADTVTDKKNPCSYASLIEDIVSYVDHVTNSRKGPFDNPKGPQRFFIASTFNLRTELGKGMPTQIRKGVVWETVSKFFMSVRIGHYERWSQCPDLLRKTWKGAVELPYLPIAYSPDEEFSTSNKYTEKPKYNFFFAGRLLLFGPERVCSVRNSIASLSTRSDTLIVNTTTNLYYSTPPNDRLFELAKSSVFCLIGKADSYSTSFFYTAIQAGCIPVVISDWFTFAYPWMVPYDKFVIRISEESFLQNPNEVMNRLVDRFIMVKEQLGSSGKKEYYSPMLREMIAQMKKWRSLLGFDYVNPSSSGYNLFTDNLMVTNSLALKGANSSSFVATSSSAMSLKSDNQNSRLVSLPFDILLYELRFQSLDGLVRKDLPCYAPGTCSIDGATPQVKPLPLSSMNETRSHLCQQVHRLIGMYKIVYFMQCVRILWPLKPGALHKYEVPSLDASPVKIRGKIMGRLTFPENDFIQAFHNINRTKGWDFITYPYMEGSKDVVQIHDLDKVPKSEVISKT